MCGITKSLHADKIGSYACYDWNPTHHLKEQRDINSRAIQYVYQYWGNRICNSLCRLLQFG